MTKRALIVDDSRSARVILSRMLESYGLVVDSSESAEQALEYLRQNRPDVVFMDHLMPGMDGFQAIQAIKGNPDTATIPVVMYTSQEGELYVSQARALGAVGVLPKTVKQADVSRVLYQLRLLPDRRELRATQPGAPAGTAEARGGVHIESTPAVSIGQIEAAMRAAIAPALKEHGAEMRRLMLASLEAFARRITAEPKPTAPAAPAAPVAEPEPIEPPRAPSRWPLAAGIAALALIPTLVLGILQTRTLESTRAVVSSNAELAATVQEQQAQLNTLQQTLQARAALVEASATAAQTPEAEPVPYGEAPLAGARLEKLRALVAHLRSAGFRGTVKVATYVGEFCLTGNGLEGYSLAADDLPMKRCDMVGNPFDDGLNAAQRQSLGFANLVSSVRQETADALTIVVAHEGRRPAVPYPDSAHLANLTAGEWNRIAAQNNRVEFSTEART